MIGWAPNIQIAGSATTATAGSNVATVGGSSLGTPSRTAGTASPARSTRSQQSFARISVPQASGAARSAVLAARQQQWSKVRPIVRQKYWLPPVAPNVRATRSNPISARARRRTACILLSSYPGRVPHASRNAQTILIDGHVGGAWEPRTEPRWTTTVLLSIPISRSNPTSPRADACRSTPAEKTAHPACWDVRIRSIGCSKYKRDPPTRDATRSVVPWAPGGPRIARRAT